MKHTNIMIGKQGYARRNRPGATNWEYLAKVFPTHREHIKRIRKSANKLLILGARLVKKYGLPR